MLRNLDLFGALAGKAAAKAGPGRLPRLLLAVAALGIISLFAGWIWMLYARGETVAAPILVEAPAGPIKTKPEDRGGMEVPYRDKLVFSRLTGEPLPAVERLRPGVETVPERPEVPRLEPVVVAARDVVGGRAAAGGESLSTVQEAVERPAVSGRLRADQWAVQVAAFRQRRHAIAWLFRAQDKYPEVFGGLEDDVVEGVKNRMRYYRVRFGPFADYAAANAKCDEVRKANLNCITVAPETEQE